MIHDDGGHFGIQKTMIKIQLHFYFVKMSKFIKKYLSGCNSCQENKIPRSKPLGLLEILQLPPSRWSHVAMDICVSMPLTAKNNNAFIVSMNPTASFGPISFRR